MALFRAISNSLLARNFYLDFPFRAEFESKTRSEAQSSLAKFTKRSLDSRGSPGVKRYYKRRVSSPSNAVRNGGEMFGTAQPLSSAGEVGLVEAEQCGTLVSEYGWSVRKMSQEESEMRRVVDVQAKAFHVPMPLFDDLFFEFFKAEVLAGLIHKLRNSPPDRYACLVAEPSNSNTSDSVDGHEQGLVGVVDVTVLRDENVLRHLNGAEEYVYVSGIAVFSEFRRRKIATVLLKACDFVSLMWGYDYLVLRAYEDDLGAQALYTNADYKVVSRDPIWMTTWIGRKRRVLMIKQFGPGNCC